MTSAGPSPSARRLLLGLAILDLMVFGAWIGREELARRAGTEVRLPVTGFDPRDLLSGHYVRFQLVAAGEAGQIDASAAAPGGPGEGRDRRARRAYCLEVGADGLAHVVRRRGPRDGCPLFISATPKKYGALDFGVERFYVDERRRAEVTRLEADAGTYLRARLFDGGRVHAVDLVVKGQSLGGR